MSNDVRRIEPYLLRGMPDLARAIDALPPEQAPLIAGSYRTLADQARETEAAARLDGNEAGAASCGKAAVILDRLADEVELGAALQSQRQSQLIERYEAEIGDVSD